MKKLFCVLLALLLTACGGGEATDEEIADHQATIQPVNCDIPGNCK